MLGDDVPLQPSNKQPTRKSRWRSSNISKTRSTKSRWPKEWAPQTRQTPAHRCLVATFDPRQFQLLQQSRLKKSLINTNYLNSFYFLFYKIIKLKTIIVKIIVIQTPIGLSIKSIINPENLFNTFTIVIISIKVRWLIQLE